MVVLFFFFFQIFSSGIHSIFGSSSDIRSHPLLDAVGRSPFCLDIAAPCIVGRTTVHFSHLFPSFHEMVLWHFSGFVTWTSICTESWQRTPTKRALKAKESLALPYIQGTSSESLVHETCLFDRHRMSFYHSGFVDLYSPMQTRIKLDKDLSCTWQLYVEEPDDENDDSFFLLPVLPLPVEPWIFQGNTRPHLSHGYTGPY